MAKRKKTKKSKTKRMFFKGGTSKRKSRRKTNYHTSLMRFLKVFAMACISAAMGIGFILALWYGLNSLEVYVKKNSPAWDNTSTLQLIDVPGWVNQPLKEKIFAAAATSQDVKSDEELTRIISNNIAMQVAWLDEIRVQTTHDSIQITGNWRKPLALVKSGLNKFYVDSDLVVLDFVPIPNLHIVRVEGLPLITKTPPPGIVWQRDDLTAAVEILAHLERMDKILTPEKPLIYDIASIDMSNFEGRENSRFPHIVLYTNDNTEIIWGAEVGAWQKHLESTDQQKLAKLYQYYKTHDSLLGGVKYINLRDPQDNVPLPIDKY